jgi:hypothetical protein
MIDNYDVFVAFLYIRMCNISREREEEKSLSGSA